jgi:hypothetical protein
MQLDAMGLDNVQAKIFQPVKGDAPFDVRGNSFLSVHYDALMTLYEAPVKHHRNLRIMN